MRRAVLRGSAVCGAGTVGIAYYQRLPRTYGDHRAEWSECMSSRIYRTCILPVVTMTDPESAHHMTLLAGRMVQAVRLFGEPLWTGPSPVDWLLRPAPSASTPLGPSIRQELFGLKFETPFGIAAGFDKHADLVPLYRVGLLPGLGFAEVGSVSALSSSGNPKPRLFRLPGDEAVINRMGLNNLGSEAIAARFASFEVLGSAAKPVAGAPARAPVGINITKTHSPDIMGDAAVDDFVTSFSRLARYADYLVLNISCPNTAEGKTFEDRQTLEGLLSRIAKAKQQVADTAAVPPILVKLAPPLDTAQGREQLKVLVAVARASGVVDGFVISNTAGDREVPLSREGRQESEAIGRGGVSGRPLRPRSTAAIKEVYRLTGGALPIIGVGGVDSPEAAYEKIRAGASLIQVYTGLVYKGPSLFTDMQTGLRRLLERDGFKSVAEAVGVDAR